MEPRAMSGESKNSCGRIRTSCMMRRGRKACSSLPQIIVGGKNETACLHRNPTVGGLLCRTCRSPVMRSFQDCRAGSQSRRTHRYPGSQSHRGVCWRSPGGQPGRHVQERAQNRLEISRLHASGRWRQDAGAQGEKGAGFSRGLQDPGGRRRTAHAHPAGVLIL